MKSRLTARGPVRVATSAVLLAGVLAGCSGGGGGSASGDTSATTSAGGAAGGPATGATSGKDAWTIVLVQAGDNNLESALIGNLDELTRGVTNDRVNVLVLSDRSPNDTDKGHTGKGVGNLPGWQNALTLRLDKGKFVKEADLGPVDTGKPDALVKFIGGTLKDHPAEHYAVLFADHGAGWPGILSDDPNKDKLSLPELAFSLQESLTVAGIPKIDLIGMDACLMATIETAHVLAPFADYLLASEELEPAHGWDYSATKVLNANPDAPPVDLARSLLLGYRKLAEQKGTVDQVTLSLLDLRKTAQVESAIVNLTKALTPELRDAAGALGARRTQGPAYGSNPNPTADAFTVDLQAVLGGVGTTVPAAAAASTLLADAVGKMVVTSFAGSAKQGSQGVSIYFPPQVANLKPSYGKLGFTAEWSRFLVDYLQAGQTIPAENQPGAKGPLVVTAAVDGDNLKATAVVPELSVPNLTDMRLFVGGAAGADGSIPLIVDTPGSADLGSGTVTALWNRRSLKVSDGTTTIDLYRSRRSTDDLGRFTVDIPFGYFEPGAAAGTEPKEVLAQATIDNATFKVVQVSLYAKDAQGLTSEFTPDVTGSLVASRPALKPDGTLVWSYAVDKKVPADISKLTLDFVPVLASTPVTLVLKVSDYGGNEVSGNASVTADPRP